MCRTHSQNRRIIKELIKISQKITEDNLSVKLNGLSIRGRNEMCLNETLLTLKLNPKESMSVCRDLRQNRNCAYFLNLLKKKGEVENPVLIAPELFNKPIDAEELINFCKDKRLLSVIISGFSIRIFEIYFYNLLIKNLKIAF